MTFGIDSVTTDSLLLADTDVDTLSDAQTTINSLDAAIDFINDQRSNLGAVQNRLGFASSNLMSRIQDTGFSRHYPSRRLCYGSQQPSPHANTNIDLVCWPRTTKCHCITVSTEVEFNSNNNPHLTITGIKPLVKLPITDDKRVDYPGWKGLLFMCYSL